MLFPVPTGDHLGPLTGFGCHRLCSVRYIHPYLHEPGAGARGNLECRVADLQGRLLSTPARTPAEVAARLEVAAGIVQSLGPRGYLLDLIQACIADLHALAAAPPASGRTPG